MTIEIRSTTDVHEALATAAPFLQQDPVATTVLGSVMTTRSATSPAATSPEAADERPAGRYWLASEVDEVVGVGMRSPIDFMFSMAAAKTEVAHEFARQLHHTEHDLTAVSGEARISAAFAGEWASLRGCRAAATTSQQLYELDDLIEPEPQTGQRLAVRLAKEADVALLCKWLIGFDQETFDHGHDPEPIIRSKLGSLWILTDHDESCSMAGATPATNGVRRIQSVYTPTDQRGRGYGAAVTAAVSRALIEDGDRTVLFTDLANPVSNRIYRRLGFRPCGEHINWTFS